MAIDFPVVNSDPSLPWLNPDTGITYIYKDGAWRVLSSTDFEDLEDIYVNVSGDTMTGELSLSAAGTVDITADALSVYHGGNYNAFIDWGGNAAFYDLIGEDAHFTRSVEVGATGDVKITLNADGSAEFAQDRVKINASGDYALETSTFVKVQGGVTVTRSGGTRIDLGTADPNSANKAAALGFTADDGATYSYIYADGGASFAGNVHLGSYRGVTGGSSGVSLFEAGAIDINNTDANTRLFYGRLLGGINSSITAGGAAIFTSVNGQTFTINLEPDNDDNYTVTTEEYTETESYTGPLGNTLEREVTKTRDVRTYTGPTLDVKERLQNLIARLDAIEANEVVDDATDNSLLLAVAELTSRLNERDALITTLTTRIEALENA